MMNSSGKIKFPRCVFYRKVFQSIQDDDADEEVQKSNNEILTFLPVLDIIVPEGYSEKAKDKLKYASPGLQFITTFGDFDMPKSILGMKIDTKLWSTYGFSMSQCCGPQRFYVVISEGTLVFLETRAEFVGGRQSIAEKIELEINEDVINKFEEIEGEELQYLDNDSFFEEIFEHFDV